MQRSARFPGLSADGLLPGRYATFDESVGRCESSYSCPGSDEPLLRCRLCLGRGTVRRAAGLNLTQPGDFRDVLRGEDDFSLSPARMGKPPAGGAVPQPGLSAPHKGSCLGWLEEFKIHGNSLQSRLLWLFMHIDGAENMTRCQSTPTTRIGHLDSPASPASGHVQRPGVQLRSGGHQLSNAGSSR